MGQPEQLTVIKPKKKESKNQNPSGIIDSRKTDEIVVAICGAVGSGTSTVAQEIEKRFHRFSYKTTTIKISVLIDEKSRIPDGLSKYERIKYLQDAGNDLREKHGSDYLAQLAIERIVNDRLAYAEDEHGKTIDESNYGKEIRVARRHVTIIDSLKHPDEVDLLKKVYGKMFCLFGILCNDKKRKDRLTTEKRMTDSEAADLMERDKKEKIDHGQQLIKTLQHSDFFIRNNKTNIASLENPIKRFISLLLGQNDITPTIDEFGMYIAESAARRSGCLSRQVGAAILTDDGDIVATGRNDVPSATGGLYKEEDGIRDARCLRRFDHACSNEKNKTNIFIKIDKILRGLLGQNVPASSIGSIMKELESESEIKDLLEYSRAVHAEMDAITSAARNGNFPLKGTNLYSTTFPCHHCARHIVASGIKTVYYIEPYEKSLATKLHSDAIVMDSAGCSDDGPKVIFMHFEGVAPRRYLDLFSCNDRKEKGSLKEKDPSTQRPTAASQLDTFTDYEIRVVDYLKSQEKQPYREDRDE